MKKVDDAISESLGIANERSKISKPLMTIDHIPPKEETGDDIVDDYELSRRTFKDLITKGQKAIDDLSDIASMSENPKAYEVVATLMKTVADMTNGLYEIHRKTKELKVSKDKPTDETAITVDKAVFVGTTKDLLRSLKQQKNEENS